MIIPSEVLSHAVQGILGLDDFNWTHCMQHHKDKPHKDLLDMSCRGLMIWMSEECLKPKFGKTIVSDLAIRKAQRVVETSVIVDNVGFTYEVDPWIDAFGSENVFLLQLEREGCTFEGDSRGYIDTDKLKQPIEAVMLINDSDNLPTFREQLKNEMTAWGFSW